MESIGVFDSGLGGLTVLRSLQRRLPFENFLYLGDVARLPYGTKSPAVVARYAERCVQYLIERGVKAVVVACNTATASALPELQKLAPVPVFGVVEPGVQAALVATRNQRILVAATRSTVRSEAYLKAFHGAGSKAEVRQVECPLLVPLAEEGWFNTAVTRTILREYLAPYAEFDFDTCLLGCTHYPLLEAAFAEVLGPERIVTHGADYLAEALEKRLRDMGVLSRRAETGQARFLSTDVVSSHSPIPSQLFGAGAAFEAVDL